MAYTKTSWVNDSTPAISAENLNKIEQSLADSAGYDGVDALRGVTPVAGGTYYLRYHKTEGDGGHGVFRAVTNGLPGQFTGEDDNGITLLPTGGNGSAKFVRDFTGAVNVRWFGAQGDGVNDDTAAIQAAIDFANSESSGGGINVNPGIYVVSTLTLKSNVSISGDNRQKTQFIAKSGTSESMLTLDSGPIVNLRMENLWLKGVENTDQHCMHFDATVDGTSTGGLWYGYFKDIVISNFDGHCIWLKGGATSNNLPHQFNRFDGVSAVTNGYAANRALLMTGQVAQSTFINCRFDGAGIGSGSTLNIESTRQYTNGSISGGKSLGGSSDGNNAPTLNNFITCTSQSADKAFYIELGQGTYINACWFENLQHCIEAVATTDALYVSKCRFANACADGSGTGYGIKIDGSSSAVIEDNYIIGSKDFFIYGNNHLGIKSSGNIGDGVADGLTTGFTRNLFVSGNAIDFKSIKDAIVSTSTNSVNTITSRLYPGEQIKIKAHGSPGTYLKFVSGGNISLPQNVLLRAGDFCLLQKSDLGGIWSFVGLYKARLQSITMPTANYYEAGEFVWKLNPFQSSGKILIGWMRLTTGTSHVLDTDWSACYATTS